MRRKNIVGGLVLLVLAIAYGVLTAQLPARTLPNTPDPSFFPWVNTVIILVLSVLLVVNGLKLPAEAPEPVDTDKRHRSAWALGAFVAYVVALPGLGFILATLPFFAVMMILFGERRPVHVGGGALGATILLYAIFRHGFGVFLPRGLLAGIVA